MPLPPPTPEMIARQQARNKAKSSKSGLLASKAAALASRALDSSESWLRQRNEQARETVAALESLSKREAQLKAVSESLSSELQTWKSRETQQQIELKDLKELTKELNRNTNSLNKATKRLNEKTEKLKDEISWHQATFETLKAVLKSLGSESLSE